MRRGAVRWVVALPVLLGALDLTVVTAVLPAIVAELVIPVPDGFRLAAWLVTGYLTAYAAAVALGGVVADRHGVRTAFLGATGVFVVGSLLVATGTGAPTRWVLRAAFELAGARPDPSMTALGVLIVARAVQAVGAGAVVPAAMAAVSSDPSRRLRDLGFIAGVDMAGWMFGHLYGGLMVQALDWRAIFWINVPLAVAVMILVGRRLPGEPSGARGRWAGAIAGASGVALVALAVASTLSPGLRVAVGVAGGAVAWIFFDRLVPPEVVKGDRPAVAGNVLIGLLVFFVLAAVPLYVGTVLESDTVRAALVTGVLLSGFTLPMAVAAPIGGRLASRAERPLVLGASAVGLVGLLLCRGWDETAGSMVVGLTMAGLGLGGLLALCADRLVRRTDRDRGAASAAVIVLRLVGMALGTALLTEWVLGRVARVGDAASVQAAVMGIFDEAFVLAVVAHVALALTLLVGRGSGFGATADTLRSTKG